MFSMKRSGCGEKRQARRGFPWWFFTAALAVLAIMFVAAAPVHASSPYPIRVKENVVVDRTGDGKFSVEVKLPVLLYTALKAQTPNTSLLLRQLGLGHQEYFQIEGIHGSFEDSDSTVRIDWTTRGLARMGQDRMWQVPVSDDDGLEVVSLRDNVAIFSAASQTAIGLATEITHVELPAGSSGLRMLKSPSRLAFRAPPTADVAGGTTNLDFAFEVKPQVMSCLAKTYGTRKFSKMWVARTVLKNTGDQKLRNYRVRFRLAEYTAAWGPWKHCLEVLPGQTVVDAYFPVFDLEKMGRVNSSRRATLEIEYQYTRADGERVQETDSRTLQILGRNEVFFHSMELDEVTSFHEAFDYGPAILASFVTRDDPIIQQVAGWVSGQLGGAGSSFSDEEAVRFMSGLYEFMAANRIAYQTPPGVKVNGHFGQHVKYGRDVLQNRAGTCIDLAIFYGSVCEAVGLKPVLFLIPGHCFPGVYLPTSGKTYAVETTMVGRFAFDQAAKRGMEEVKQATEKGPAITVNIAELRELGVYGLELPTLPANTLAEWGIRQVTATTRQSADQPTARAANPKTPLSIVGKWRFYGKLEEDYIEEMQFIFTRDGLYSFKLSGVAANGARQNFAASGTYRVDGDKIVLKPQDGDQRVLPYSFRDGYLWVTVEVIGYRIPMEKIY